MLVETPEAYRLAKQLLFLVGLYRLLDSALFLFNHCHLRIVLMVNRVCLKLRLGDASLDE